MISKIKKIFSFIGIISKQPSLVNLILKDNLISKKKFTQKYTNFIALPQIELSQLAQNVPKTVQSFLLDGSSLITDLQLLATLASREDVNSYFEIGTWRGESVYNVSNFVEDCTTLNLSAKDIEAMGFGSKYAEQHGILSKERPQVLHLFGNTKNFDFASLNKKYDLIFIDGDHSYEMVLNDTRRVFQHLMHENSIVVWHDYAYSPQKIRYEVFQAILDGVGKENHSKLYHPKNTMCAIYINSKLASTPFDELRYPEKIFEVTLSEKEFNA